jgi:hypothetical protein
MGLSALSHSPTRFTSMYKTPVSPTACCFSRPDSRPVSAYHAAISYSSNGRAPTTFIEDFTASGADVITAHAEVGKSEADAAIEATLRARRSAGLALRLDTLVAACAPSLDRVDALLLLGAALGAKGQDLAPAACDRLARAASVLGKRRARVRLIADGAIRSHTVPPGNTETERAVPPAFAHILFS